MNVLLVCFPILADILLLFLLSGQNFPTETCMPPVRLAWLADWRHECRCYAFGLLLAAFFKIRMNANWPHPLAEMEPYVVYYLQGLVGTHSRPCVRL